MNKHDITNLVRHINRKQWWHVPPLDPDAYTKRGKFLASSYREAEFYGRPENVPHKVTISRPFICDNQSIERSLLGKIVSHDDMSIAEIAKIDRKLRIEVMKRGYDSIVLFTQKGLEQFVSSGKIPRSIELNVFE